MDLFENAVFMLSCGRVKTELFEYADVKASICDVPEHARGSLGITRGHFACLFSFIEARTVEFESSCVFVWTGIFSKTLLMWTRIFFDTDKKDAFSKKSGYVWTGPENNHNRTVFCYILSNFRICPTLIKALTPLDRMSCIKMYKNNARSSLFCRIAERSIAVGNLKMI